MYTSANPCMSMHEAKLSRGKVDANSDEQKTPIVEESFRTQISNRPHGSVFGAAKRKRPCRPPCGHVGARESSGGHFERGCVFAAGSNGHFEHRCGSEAGSNGNFPHNCGAEAGSSSHFERQCGSERARAAISSAHAVPSGLERPFRAPKRGRES